MAMLFIMKNKDRNGSGITAANIIIFKKSRPETAC
jgi:hypothetical protein